MYNSKIFYTVPKDYNARQLSTHLIFTAIITSMVITADPSHQPPLSSCIIACYRGAVDGGRWDERNEGRWQRYSVKDNLTVQNSICKKVMHDIHLQLKYYRVTLGMTPFKIGEGVEQL